MFVVVRNVKSQPQGDDQPRFSAEYRVNKGDTIKMGRLKFLVKDYLLLSQQSKVNPINQSVVRTQNNLMMEPRHLDFNNQHSSSDDDIQIGAHLVRSSTTQVREQQPLFRGEVSPH